MELRLEKEKHLWDSFERHWRGTGLQPAFRTSASSLDSWCKCWRLGFVLAVYRAFNGWINTVASYSVWCKYLGGLPFFVSHLLDRKASNNSWALHPVHNLFLVLGVPGPSQAEGLTKRSTPSMSWTYPVCSRVSANSQFCTKQPNILLKSSVVGFNLF